MVEGVKMRKVPGNREKAEVRALNGCIGLVKNGSKHRM
jgi:hypothetical protein